MGFAVDSALNSLTSLVVDIPQGTSDQAEFCAVLKPGCFPNLSYLDVTVYAICPALIDALSQRRIACKRDEEPKPWRIRTSPHICETWMEKNGLVGSPVGLTFAFLSGFVHKARAAVISHPSSPLSNTSFSVQTFGFMNKVLGMTRPSMPNGIYRILTTPQRVRCLCTLRGHALGRIEVIGSSVSNSHSRRLPSPPVEAGDTGRRASHLYHPQPPQHRRTTIRSCQRTFADPLAVLCHTLRRTGPKTRPHTKHLRTMGTLSSIPFPPEMTMTGPQFWLKGCSSSVAARLSQSTTF